MSSANTLLWPCGPDAGLRTGGCVGLYRSEAEKEVGHGCKMEFPNGRCGSSLDEFQFVPSSRRRLGHLRWEIVNGSTEAGQGHHRRPSADSVIPRLGNLSPLSTVIFPYRHPLRQHHHTRPIYRLLLTRIHRQTSTCHAYFLLVPSSSGLSAPHP